MTIAIGCGTNTLDDWRRILNGSGFTLADEAARNIDRGEASLREIMACDQPVYGVNTGFGKLASERIARDDVETLQRNLVLSHSAGVGPWIEPDVVRLIIALKLASLAHGCSGMRRSTAELMVRVVDEGLLPAIPVQGSVGASGDLAPLAHLGAALIGEGEFLVDGRAQPAAPLLRARGIEPLVLSAKEGLALVNGTQVSTALAIKGLFGTETALLTSLVAGAMSLEGVRGTTVPFDRRIHALRPHRGQRDVARALVRLLEGSGIRQRSGRTQDPYSFRCMPQVQGACLDALRHAASILEVEARSVTDNPLIFDGGDVLSGGNFHAEPVAFAADHLALAAVETGSISERRTTLLLDAGFSGLPPFLAEDAGLNSGFMITQVTAAALVAESRQMAHPAVVDSIPTSANQEDHVSMATHGARRLLPLSGNIQAVIAIELLAAAQALDVLALPSSPALERARAVIRGRIPRLDRDRWFKPDLDAATDLVATRAIIDCLDGDILPVL